MFHFSCTYSYVDCTFNTEFVFYTYDYFVIGLRPSLSKEFMGTIFGTIYRISNRTTNRAKTSSKTRYNFRGFCTISWYHLRYNS